MKLLHLRSSHYVGTREDNLRPRVSLARVKGAGVLIFFAALGWQVHNAALSADAADFWGADMTQVAERWLAPSGACEVVLLPVANTTAVLRPLDCAVTTPGGLFDINMRTWDSVKP